MRRVALALALLFSAVAGSAANFPVTTGGDSGPGTLRQAILDANQSNACPCTITLPPIRGFDYPPFVVNLTSPLPPITASNLHIGAAIGNIYGPIPAATVRGPGDGLRIENATNVTIEGVALTGFDGNGMVVDHSSGIKLLMVSLDHNGANGLLIVESGSMLIQARINFNAANGIYATRSSGLTINSSIGTDENRSALPNGANGVHLDSVRGASLAFSIIRHNKLTGLLITGDSGDNSFEYATFEDNGLLGIDIGGDGPTPDGAPVIESANFNRNFVRVKGSVHSIPNSLIRVMVYVSAQPDPSGFGEGAEALSLLTGRSEVVTNGQGDAAFVFDFNENSSHALRHNYVTAIATGLHGSSEFSRAVPVVDQEPNFVVTNTLDAGPGSLRDAIEQANQSLECAVTYPCGIVFNISDPPYTIQPRSALPAVTQAAVWIDGGTQRPEINGALCGACNGLELRPAANKSLYTVIRNLVVNGFSGDGIVVSATSSSFGSMVRFIDSCYVGTDRSGTNAVPNGRGIFVDKGVVSIGGVFDNRLPTLPGACVISGNRGDGVAVDIGGSATMYSNRIGTDWTGFVPLGNAGNGIHSAGTIDAERNIIAFNGERGVVVEKNAKNNVLLQNEIHSNRDLGIDIGGDGVTDEGAPVITSAHMLINTARITFRAPVPPLSAVLVTLVNFYSASFTDASGRGEGRTFVGSAYVRAPDSGEQTVDLPVQLAGKYLSATATLFDVFYFGGVGTTSEFSRAVQVTAGDCPTLTPIIESAYSWSALPGATEYRIWFMAPGDQPKIAYRGTETQANVSLPSGSEWWVEARFDPCYGTQSEHHFVP